jgi:hypothetical protein
LHPPRRDSTRRRDQPFTPECRIARAGVRGCGSYITVGHNAGDIKASSPVVIRYADDMIALCHSQRQAEQVKASLAEWLAPRGLVFNEDKTAIVPLSTGFDFLGFNVRRYARCY